LRLLAIEVFRVEDSSMQPAIRPGDRLLVSGWLRPRPGDVIVFRDPEARSSFAIKRVTRVGSAGEIQVSGDNPNVSRDSRHFGPVPGALIVGRVFYRYLPRERRGTL
jgi:nickel-type superoxide dismutase maturation protease